MNLPGPKQRTMLDESHGSITNAINQPSFKFYATDATSADNAATITTNVAAVTPTPAPASVAEATPTPVPNVWNAPSTSGWGLAALVAGMLVVMVIALGLTSGSRRGARP